MAVDQERFNELTGKAIENLPPEFLELLENVDVVVEDNPTPEQLHQAKIEEENSLLGLYEGVPQTLRTSGYNMVLPDKITLFQKPIEAICRNEENIYSEIQKTLKHEIAHHFGISDERLKELNNFKDKGP